MASTAKHGIELLRDPSSNKSTAFTEAEKQALGMVGLIPDVTESVDLQLQRVMLQLAQKKTDLERYIYLINLLDHNETLFYRTVMSDLLKNWPEKDVRFIYVTDCGRILGLGDLGANGAGIPIGKLQLYTTCAGVPPQYLLLMYLEAGTNNEQYLQ